MTDDTTTNWIAARGTELPVGTRLGPYRVEGTLGEGGMGGVFRAIDTRLGRAVAIKIAYAQFSARFQREARAIASLNHPNICILHDIGPNYLVMELVDGETIAARLQRGALPVREAVTYAQQIAAALAEAHRMGIVHRDLKPGNIMLTRAGAKVLDFGLATFDGDRTLTVDRMVMGTPAYMAPEQRQGQATDARTDIYAFGLVLYEMLAGERVAAPRKRLRVRKLDTIVGRCLEEDPSRRWQSAANVQAELEATTRTPSPRKQKAPHTTRIMLAELENKTGDPIFDGILRQGLSAQLAQSPYLSIVSDQQIQQVLRLMKRPTDTRLAPDVAQEIGERAGATAVLDGSIASLGGRFILWLRARNCQTGDILGQEQAQVERAADVLNALASMAGRVTARLGETPASTGEHPLALELATTSSLDALRAYSDARRAVFTRGLSAAIPHLQRAIAIDPEFATAYADLGFFYWNMGQTDLAQQPTLKAYELRDQVSDRERFFILFLYDRQVTGNLQKELETIEAWAHTYPDDVIAWGVLGGWGTFGTGQYEKGVRASERAIQLNPSMSPAYAGSATHALSLGRFADASAALQRAAERNIEIPTFLPLRYYLAFLDSNEEGMQREVQRARGNLEAESWMSHNQALVLARAGRMRDARVRWQHAVELVRQAGDREKAAIYRAAEAVCEAHLGNRDQAMARAREALELGKGRDIEYAAAFALALSGDLAETQRLVESLGRRFPEDTPVQFEYLPTLRALVALSQRKPREAIERLHTALPYDLAMPGTAFYAKFGGLYPVYVRGMAYLDAGMGRDAAAEFQKVLDHRGIVLADPIGALAYLQLGRALALSGEPEKARGAYTEFLTLWSDADSELPVLAAAAAEHAAFTSDTRR